MSASDAMSRVRPTPLATLGLCSGPFWSLGCRPPFIPLSYLCPRLTSSPCESPYPVIFLCLSSFFLGWTFSRAKVRGPGASTPWQLLAPAPDFLCYLAMTEPCRLPPPLPLSPSTHIVLIPTPWLNFVGVVLVVTCEFRSHQRGCFYC